MYFFVYIIKIRFIILLLKTILYFCKRLIFLRNTKQNEQRKPIRENAFRITRHCK